MNELEVECGKCGWQSAVAMLCCSDEDFHSDKDTEDIVFNICPDCGSTDIHHISEDEE
jgi:ribosomal protein S27AE